MRRSKVDKTAAAQAAAQQAAQSARRFAARCESQGLKRVFGRAVLLLERDGVPVKRYLTGVVQLSTPNKRGQTVKLVREHWAAIDAVDAAEAELRLVLSSDDRLIITDDIITDEPEEAAWAKQ